MPGPDLRPSAVTGIFCKVKHKKGSSNLETGSRSPYKVARKDIWDETGASKNEQKGRGLMEWLAFIWSLITRTPRLRILVGIENRPDNVHVMKDFLFVDVVNASVFTVGVTDVSITYRLPYARKTIKSIIVAEEQSYPIKLRRHEQLRINLLPGLIDLPRIDFISATLESGREFRLKSVSRHAPSWRG